MLDHDLSHKTRYDRLIVVKQLFKWAARNRLVETNPLAAAELIRQPSPSPQPCFTPEQVGLLLANAHPDDRPLFGVMAYAGLRYGEVRDLEWGDIEFAEAGGFICVSRGGSAGTTKGGRPRRVPLHPVLSQLLGSVARRGPRVFYCRHYLGRVGKLRPLVERVLLMSLKKLCRDCGLVHPNRYKLHTFRHAFCSMCARNSVAYRYALGWMGHRRSDVLDHYYHMFDATALAAIRTIAYPMPAPAPRDFEI